MLFSSRFSLKLVLRFIPVALLPWLPAYLFERIDFWFGITGNRNGYYSLSGYRLEADIVSFALGGLLLAYLARPRWAILQVFLSSTLVGLLLFVACGSFRTNGLLHSDCYQTGPDGLAGFRLSLMMFSYGALAPTVKAAEKRDLLNTRIRAPFALFASFVLAGAMVWFPVSAWFSGVTYLPPFSIFQGAIIIGIPMLLCGMLAARISRNLWVAPLAGVVSLVGFAGVFWTLLCPSCDRSLLLPAGLFWALFGLVGGLLELGLPVGYQLKSPFKRFSLNDARLIATALIIVICLWTIIGYGFWAPSVLYDTSISPGAKDTTLGLPSYPYVAGFYNSTKYRVCCVEIGVSFSKADPALLAPDNFLMAGMGVQSPNCCIDGWDFGWRADAFLMPDRSVVVSGSAWGTCDTNANCGGIFWQYLRYHTRVVLHPENTSTPIFLRMMWEPSSASPIGSQVNWYYNTTGVPWQIFGSFIPDYREGPYFDIGSEGTGGIIAGNPNIPQKFAYFFQFGVASKKTCPGLDGSAALSPVHVPRRVESDGKSKRNPRRRFVLERRLQMGRPTLRWSCRTS